jgi:carbamoyltransferase
MQDGILTAAAQEERFSKKKHDSAMPVKAFFYCLKEAKIAINQVDCLAYYEDPVKKLARQLWSGYDYEKGESGYRMDPKRPEREIRELLGYEGPIKYYSHHLSHAASSYYASGFKSAAILTVDGVGEWATASLGEAKGKHIKLFEEIHFPHSLGFLYSAVTGYLGFRVNSGEYKVMGLAPYGKPIYVDRVKKLLRMEDKGQFRLEMKYFDFLKGKRMYSDALIELFERPPRQPETDFSQFHKDVAKSLQAALEDVLLEKARYLFDRTGLTDLCMAGGVALNCVANSRILQDGPFQRLYVQPAAGDAGGAFGAAALAHIELSDNGHDNCDGNGFDKLAHVYLGPEYSASEIYRLLRSTSLVTKDYRLQPEKLINEAAQRLSRGKVIGWFQGRMEYGPRALGARSILADPRDPDMRDKINAMVKKREAFRPFAPVVLEEKAREHFDIDHPSPFMLETCKVISRLNLPAITHVNGSARIQTIDEQSIPRYVELLKEFDRLNDCPILLNTSFNVRGQPIVCSPVHALLCFINTEIDSLVLGDFIIDKEDNSIHNLRKLLVYYQNPIKSDIEHNVYTFI